ncbi:hypothetical protein BT67DRAFT_166634 [Trichocladium antarcticum]|uniref:Uncharacterized protein n=1 Tax=Trichocladium antarcticum TaxID=1450529 RepID=A0AAN6Z9W5_9PEZI|nr:hypothetical protein BT67DRAFT_166634 [Trichocladium antarcticum]
MPDAPDLEEDVMMVDAPPLEPQSGLDLELARDQDWGMDLDEDNAMDLDGMDLDGMDLVDTNVVDMDLDDMDVDDTAVNDDMELESLDERADVVSSFALPLVVCLGFSGDRSADMTALHSNLRSSSPTTPLPLPCLLPRLPFSSLCRPSWQTHTRSRCRRRQPSAWKRPWKDRLFCLPTTPLCPPLQTTQPRRPNKPKLLWWRRCHSSL